MAAELRYGATKKDSSKLSTQLEAVLGALETLPLEAPVGATYKVLRTRRFTDRRQRLAYRGPGGCARTYGSH